MSKLVEFQNKNGDTLRGILNDAETDHVVIFVHGFERTTATEKKFKDLADTLFTAGVSSFRFDFTGTGLSDGDFKYTTVTGMADDLKNAILEAQKYGKRISVVAHSLGTCVVAKQIEEDDSEVFDKIVLLAPALNQKDLLRFWFTVSMMKKEDSSLKITWSNYKHHLDEDKFLEDCSRGDKIARTHYIQSDYFLENKNKDYEKVFKSMENILHIHGDDDDKVPLDSLGIEFKNKFIVKNGDHDLERPGMIKQWLPQAVGFLED